MAFYLNQTPDEDEEGAPKPAAASPYATSAPASGLPGSPAPTEAAPKPSTGSGRFVGFDRILGLNQPQAQATAAGLSRDVEGKAQAARDSLAQGQSAFQAQVQNGYSASGDAAHPYTAQHYGVGRTAYHAAPVQYTYTGPQAFDTSPYAAAFSGAQSDLNALGSTEGVQGLLQQRAKSPYTQNQSRWDAALTGAVGNFGEAQNRFSGFDSLLTNAATQGYAAVDAGRQHVDALNAAAQQQATSATAAANAQAEQQYAARRARQAETAAGRGGRKMDSDALKGGDASGREFGTGYGGYGFDSGTYEESPMVGANRRKEPKKVSK